MWLSESLKDTVNSPVSRRRKPAETFFFSFLVSVCQEIEYLVRFFVGCMLYGGEIWRQIQTALVNTLIFFCIFLALNSFSRAVCRYLYPMFVKCPCTRPLATLLSVNSVPISRASFAFRSVGADSALNIFMDVRRTDRKASLASVAGEVEMEEQGDGAKLLKSKASTRPRSCCTMNQIHIHHIFNISYAPGTLEDVLFVRICTVDGHIFSTFVSYQVVLFVRL